jgi:hypothetical protein
LNPKDLKRHLVAEGFQVFRTLGSCVVLADRVRDNLIMDSGVAAEASPEHRVKVVIRARSGDYPGESEDQLFARVRALAEAELDPSYAEFEQAVIPVDQPSAPGERLDTWYEVTFVRTEADLAALMLTLRDALTVKKIA